MTKQMNLRLDEDLIKEFEELAEQENLDRSALVRKILIEGLQQERLNFALQKYMIKEISIERAAEIAKIPLHDLILKMSQLGIPSNLTMADFEKILWENFIKRKEEIEFSFYFIFRKRTNLYLLSTKKKKRNKKKV